MGLLRPKSEQFFKIAYVYVTELKDTAVKSGEVSSEETDHSSLAGDDKPVHMSRFGENQSTIVSRVPNKSVEDLHHTDCSSCQGTASLSPLAKTKCTHQGEPQEVDSLLSETTQETDLESLGACGGQLENQSGKLEESLDDFRVEGKILQKLLNMDKIEAEPVQTGTGFGVIKDISVSNILIDEDDKTKHFTKKDFSNLSKSKPKVIERGNARLFAANTPGEDDKVFTLLSPESDFSESSSSEVWGYRPQLVHELSLTETPETDSSFDACSYADLPNQNYYYRHGDSTNEASPVIPEETKMTNLVGASGETPANVRHMSIVEMTENLLQMTLEMQEQMDSDLSSQLSAQTLTNTLEKTPELETGTQNAYETSQPPSGENLEESRERTGGEPGKEQEIPAFDECRPTDCEIIDLEEQSNDALKDSVPDTVTVATGDVAIVTEITEHSGDDGRESEVDGTGEVNQAGETRSTFV